MTYGADVKSLALALYGEGVMSNDRIAAFLNAASGNEMNLSEGSVYGFCRKFSELSAESIRHLEEEMLNRAVVATDATPVTVNGAQDYIRNTSTQETALYHAMTDRTIDSLKRLPFFAAYAGTLVHDHETALYHFGTRHGECNAHILRYLKKNTQETENGWSVEMRKLLRGMHRERKRLKDMGASSFKEAAVRDYEKRYAACISRGREENKQTRHKYAKADEQRLLNRMEKYSQNHLLFLHDFSVPFDDNISERDLRKARNRQKMRIIENIRNLFMGTPAIF